ncbi:MAG TPA: hypothetical protein VFH78_07875 [Candidatus Thermoplasmatota archaeon]|nr:hypothetical protein [Candidatus Thermoplasmatota archaeon]
MRLPLLLALVVALAGCASPHHARLDTGDVAPEESKDLVFDRAGTYEIHCHLHPFMKQMVTVVEGDAGEPVHVHMHDGTAREEYRYEPAALEVTVGTSVSYHNHGRFVHTATDSAGMAH